MSILRMIRHAQASYFGDDYDVLSPLGEEQSRALGEHWADTGTALDRVFVGPRRRHRQTLGAVESVYRARGLDWPGVEEMTAFDEHNGQEIVDRELPAFVDGKSEYAGLRDKTPENLRLYFRAFRDITERWARGELAAPDDLESWASFRARVERGVETILAAAGNGETIAVFTSGGPVGTASAYVMGLGDVKTLHLTWRVRNTAYAEILFSDGRAVLDTFNANPHLREPRLVTYI